VEDETNVVDIGCSTGKMLKAMIQQNSFSSNTEYTGIELEKDLVLHEKKDGIVGKNTQNALNNALDQLTTDPVPSPPPQPNGFGGVTGKLPLPAIPLIKKFEGCYLKAYPDPRTGNLPITIGWGSTKKRDGSNWKLGESITQQEADDLLMLQLDY
jgi:hypothetical protein